MINILFIHQSAELYGSDKTLLLLLTYIDRQRFSPVVVLPGDGPLKKQLEELKIEVRIIPVLKLYRKIFTPKNILLFFRQIKKSVAELDKLDSEYHFDLVYSNTLAVLLGGIFARKRNKKHLWHVHEIIVHPKIIAAIFPKILMRYADRVICNSYATRENLVSRVKRLDTKTTVIHNGLELDKLPQDLTYEKINVFAEEDFVITLVGRISRLKGHKLLLQAYLGHLSKYPRIKILFVGSPVAGQEYYLEDLDAIINENSLNNVVKIMAFTKNLQHVWDITDIAVVPSTEAESFGLVALEAMLAEKAVVGSNHGGLKEVIIDNETGFLVEPGNEKQLAEAIEKLMHDNTLRADFAKSGYTRAISEFSIAKHVEKFETVFSTLSGHTS